MENLIASLESNLDKNYKVLEGDKETIYIVDKNTGKHYSIKIEELD